MKHKIPKEARINGLLYHYLVMPAVNLLVNSLFDKVHVSGFEAVLENKDNALILVPTHYSRLDFILLPLLLYRNGTAPVRILARKDVLEGKNGWWMKLTGGLAGPDKDTLVKSDYKRLKTLLEEVISAKLPLEIFAQKGRTYNGLITMEDLALARFRPILDAAQKSDTPVILYPIIITYSAVPEIEGYATLEDGLRGKPVLTEGIDSRCLKKAMFQENKTGIFIDFLRGINLQNYLEQNPKAAVVDLGRRIYEAWLQNFRPVPADIVSYSILKARKPDLEVNANELKPDFVVGADELLDHLYGTRNRVRDLGLERGNLQGLTLYDLLTQGMAALFQKKRGKVVKDIIVEEDMNTYLVKQPHVVAFYANRLEQAINYAEQHR